MDLFSIREDIHRKETFFIRALPRQVLPPTPPRGNGQRGPFFQLSKTFKRVLKNQIPIEYDDESDDYDDDNGDNFDAYDDDNDQKPSTTMTFWSNKVTLLD